MIIAIDGNEANVKSRVGSNVYAYQLLKHLHELQKTTVNAKNKFIIYLKGRPLADLPKEKTWWQYQVLKPKLLWTQWRLPLELYFSQPRPNIFFSPGHYSPRFCPIPSVISIMDLAFLRYPKQFKKKDLYQLKSWTRNSVKKASHILTISEFSKKEIIHFYNIPEQKITVVYPGIIKIKEQKSKSKDLYQNLKKKYNIGSNYFLYIGTLQPRKNLIKLLEAFKKLINHQPLIINHLIIIGKKGWMYREIFNKIKQLGLEKKVVFSGYVSEQKKFTLLKNALAFILPSLYEGFGIPVLESLSAGCPVIISNNSSLAEVAGKAGIYIKNPNSTDSIYQSMLKMVKLSHRQKKELIKEGLSQIKKFSWEKAAEKVLRVLKGL